MKTILRMFVTIIVAMNAGVAAIMLDWSDNAVIAVTVTVLFVVGSVVGAFDVDEDDHRAIRKDMHHDDDMSNVA